jgi:hypothetical protein
MDGEVTWTLTSLASSHMLASQLRGTMDQSTDERCVFQGAWEKMIQPGGAVKDGECAGGELILWFASGIL